MEYLGDSGSTKCKNLSTPDPASLSQHIRLFIRPGCLRTSQRCRQVVMHSMVWWDHMKHATLVAYRLPRPRNARGCKPPSYSLMLSNKRNIPGD